MKSRYVFTLLLMLVFCFSVAQNISAQNISDMPTITLSGLAEVRAVPNEAIFTLEVTKLNKDLQLAQKQNDDTVAQIIKLCKDFGIPAQNVKTDFYEYEEKYTWVGKDERQRLFLGYEVNKSVIIRLSDMSKFEELFRELIKTGVSKIEDVDLQTTDIRKYKDQARAMAIRAAKEKATAMASEIGQNVGKAVMIREGVLSSNISISGTNSNSFANTTSSGESYSPSYSTNENSAFSLGTISIRAEVTVSFLLN